MSPLALEEVLSRNFVSHDGELWYRHVDDIAVGESPLAKCTAPKGRLGAVLVIHQVGLPADMKAIMKLTEEQDIPVIEDTACAIGSRISLNAGATWQPIGSPIGNAVCFSFHSRKIVTTGEGGMIATSDPSIDLKVLQWRQHGMNKSTAERHSGNEFVQETYINSSGNHRMTDLQASVGIQQLTSLDLSDCGPIQNVDGLVKLSNLIDLNLRGCTSVKPKPSPVTMTTRSEVAAYQVKVMKKAGMEIPASFGPSTSSGSTKLTKGNKKYGEDKEVPETAGLRVH